MTTAIEPPSPTAPGSGPTSTDAGAVTGATSVGWKLTLREFLKNRLAVAGVAVLVFFLLLCFLGPLVYHSEQVMSVHSAGVAPTAPTGRTAATCPRRRRRCCCRR